MIVKGYSLKLGKSLGNNKKKNANPLFEVGVNKMPVQSTHGVLPSRHDISGAGESGEWRVVVGEQKIDYLVVTFVVKESL